MISSPVSNGYYPVYVDVGRGHAGYCAWHSVRTCGGVMVQFAFFFDLDGDAGCDPNDSVSGHSEGLAALANVSAHELSEARTDPHLDAWFDSKGAENSDKCALVVWSDSGTVQQWHVLEVARELVQQRLQFHDRGYNNTSGQKGCIDGGTYN